MINNIKIVKELKDGWKIIKAKENRICLNCGRKKTFIYDMQEPCGGLWVSKTNEPCLFYMKCPRCKKIAMEVIEK